MGEQVARGSRTLGLARSPALGGGHCHIPFPWGACPQALSHVHLGAPPPGLGLPDARRETQSSAVCTRPGTPAHSPGRTRGDCPASVPRTDSFPGL